MEEKTKKQPLDINFNIQPDGKVNYHGSGGESWEHNQAIDEVSRLSQKLQQISRDAELKSHLLAIAFCLVLVFSLSFMVSRIASGIFHQGGQVERAR